MARRVQRSIASRQSGIRMALIVGIIVGMAFIALAVEYPSLNAQFPPFQEPAFLSTHHDTIPNFCKTPTIVSNVANGSWTNPATWNPNRVPGLNDVVMIANGHHVTYDAANAGTATTCVGVHGTLQFSAAMSTALLVQHMLVYADGELIMGTAENPVAPPYTAELVIADRPLDIGTLANPGADPAQYGNGLIVFGKVTMRGAEKSPTFVRTTLEPMTGHSTLTLEQPVSNWRTGDRLILPDTRQFLWTGPGTAPRFWEFATVSSVSPDGRTITLLAPLQFDHKGARDNDGSLRFLPHVGNLSRTVRVRSENPAGVRGHTFYTGRAEVDIEYAEFVGLGRTTIATNVDSTIFSSTGALRHIGTNHIGRYPLHAHHLYGKEGGDLSGYQFRLIGNSIHEGSHANHTFKWTGITLHDSHYGLVQGNVIYNTAAAAITAEDGSETGNVFDGNFIVRVSGSNDRGKFRFEQTGGDGFWLAGPDSYLRNNVAANVTREAFNVYGGNDGNPFIVKVPVSRGADKMMPGQGKLVSMGEVAIPEFANNEVYASNKGIEFWYLGFENYFNPASVPVAETLVQDFRAWHLFSVAVVVSQANHVTFDNFIVRGDPAFLRQMDNTSGMLFFQLKQLVIRNADIQSLARAMTFHGPTDRQDDTVTTATAIPTIIEDSFFQTISGVHFGQVGDLGRKIPPRKTEIHNTVFTSPRRIGAGHIPRFSGAVFMEYGGLHANGNDLIFPELIYVYNHQRLPGNNFQIFYREQDPNFIVPQTGSFSTRPSLSSPGGWPIGSPEAGLTNAQNWERYGIAIGGAVAPCTDSTTHPDVYGFTCPIVSASTPLCVRVTLRQRVRAMTGSMLSTCVIEAYTPAGAFIARATVPLNSAGIATVTDADFLAEIGVQPSYALTVIPRGHFSVRLPERTGVPASCIDAGTVRPGDFDGSGSLSFMEIVRAITYYRTPMNDELLTDVYRLPATFADIIELITDYRATLGP